MSHTHPWHLDFDLIKLTHTETNSSSTFQLKESGVDEGMKDPLLASLALWLHH